MTPYFIREINIRMDTSIILQAYPTAESGLWQISPHSRKMKHASLSWPSPTTYAIIPDMEFSAVTIALCGGV
jgi:hypothetical protein